MANSPSSRPAAGGVLIAIGAILGAAIGLARASAQHDFVRANLFLIQKDLITVMGELATSVEDLERYVKDGFQLVTPEMTAKLETLIQQIEAEKVSFKGWATPGETPLAAALDLARTICRRAERRVAALETNPEILRYLNRLSDLCWLLARVAEKPQVER